MNIYQYRIRFMNKVKTHKLIIAHNIIIICNRKMNTIIIKLDSNIEVLYT